MDVHALLHREIAWHNTQDPYLFSALVDGQEIRLRLNDFPEEPLGTLLWDGGQQDLDDLGSDWTLPRDRGE